MSLIKLLKLHELKYINKTTETTTEIIETTRVLLKRTLRNFLRLSYHLVMGHQRPVYSSVQRRQRVKKGRELVGDRVPLKVYGRTSQISYGVRLVTKISKI